MVLNFFERQIKESRLRSLEERLGEIGDIDFFEFIKIDILDDILLELQKGDDTSSSILEEVKPSNTITSGQTTVPTAGIAIKLLNVKTKSILVKANTGNAGSIFIGGSGVISTTGLILAPGESVTLDHDAENEGVWINSATSGDGVSFLAIK